MPELLTAEKKKLTCSKLINHKFFHNLNESGKSRTRVIGSALQALGLLGKYQEAANLKDGLLLFISLLLFRNNNELTALLSRPKNVNSFNRMIERLTAVMQNPKLESVEVIEVCPWQCEVVYFETNDRTARHEVIGSLLDDKLIIQKTLINNYLIQVFLSIFQDENFDYFIDNN